MRRIVLSLAALGLLAFPATVGAAKTYTVKTGDDFFSPTSRTIHKKDIIKWVWVGADGKPGDTINEHTIVEAKDRFKSPTKTRGTYSVRFKSKGKFTIFCGEHPDEMKLTVRVKD
jgi:plastocyanin